MAVSLIFKETKSRISFCLSLQQILLPFPLLTPSVPSSSFDLWQLRPLCHFLLIHWHWTWIWELQSKRHCLLLTDCRPNNTCSLSLISLFTERNTYSHPSQTFWPFSSFKMHGFPVYRRQRFNSDKSPDDKNPPTPLGVTQPLLVAASLKGPSNRHRKNKKTSSR